MLPVALPPVQHRAIIIDDIVAAKGVPTGLARNGTLQPFPVELNQNRQSPRPETACVTHVLIGEPVVHFAGTCATVAWCGKKRAAVAGGSKVITGRRQTEWTGATRGPEAGQHE